MPPSPTTVAGLPWHVGVPAGGVGVTGVVTDGVGVTDGVAVGVTDGVGVGVTDGVRTASASA